MIDTFKEKHTVNSKERCSWKPFQYHPCHMFSGGSWVASLSPSLLAFFISVSDRRVSIPSVLVLTLDLNLRDRGRESEECSQERRRPGPQFCFLSGLS